MLNFIKYNVGICDFLVQHSIPNLIIITMIRSITLFTSGSVVPFTSGSVVLLLLVDL